MAGKPAPINPDVLEWALIQSGMSDVQLSDRAKIPLARLDLIRRGQVQPNTGELKAFAKSLQRPTAFFFLPKPPVQSVVPISFRGSPNAGGGHLLNSEEQSALRNAARWQRIATWVRERLELPGSDLPSVSAGSRPQHAAETLFSWLEWSGQEQRQTTSAGALLKLLRGRLEEHGILVLQFPMGQESCRGFSLPHKTAAVIALNSAYNSEARVYSILHELGHLVRGDRAVCGDPRNDRVERWCEETAAAFLMPAQEVLDYLNRWVTAGTVDDVDQVRRLANRYRVSLRAAAVRLIQLGRAEQGLYNSVNRIAEFGGSGGFNPQAERQTTPVIRIRELGTAVPKLLLNAKDSGLLPETEVRRYLNVTGSQLDDLKSRVMDTAAAEA